MVRFRPAFKMFALQFTLWHHQFSTYLEMAQLLGLRPATFGLSASLFTEILKA